MKIKQAKKAKKTSVPIVSKCKLGKFQSGDMIFEEKVIGDLWIREMIFKKKGSKKNGHKHNFDHLHYVTAGSVELFEVTEKDGKIIETSIGKKVAPAMLIVPKGMAHSVVALEDNTMASCIQPIRRVKGKPMESEYVDETHSDIRL